MSVERESDKSHLLNANLAETTFVVIDLETTGVVVGRDAVVELAAVVLAPAGEPVLALNTLVNPGRSMNGTDIHGLSEQHVIGAPPIAKFAPALHALVANRVVAGHNASFDVRFVEHALRTRGGEVALPHVCTMGLHTLLGMGSQYPLAVACSLLGVPLPEQHVAADDALACARLLRVMLRRLHEQGVRTFGQLAELAAPRVFGASLRRGFVAAPDHFASEASVVQKPRQGAPPAKASRLREYQTLVLQVVADLHISDVEIAGVRTRREQLGIDLDELCAVHARVIAAMIGRYAEDRRVDAVERDHLRRLFECLRDLGWAPGM